jgi:hypothetical protein
VKTTDPTARQYSLHALTALGIPCPEKYMAMLNAVPANEGIPGLYPWWFLPNPEATAQYASAIAGRPVLPFAQAIGQDLIACFLTDSTSEPSVIVLNPWSEVGAARTRAILANYEGWLTYAKETSERFIEREKEDADDQ